MALAPLARGLILCESATVNAVSRNLTLTECFRAFRADRFPARTNPFIITAQLVNGFGTVPVRVLIFSLNDNRVVYRFAASVNFADRMSEMRLKLEVNQFVAPAPGSFHVVLWANDELIAQTDFTIFGG